MVLHARPPFLSAGCRDYCSSVPRCGVDNGRVDQDCIIVGASFAGLACATALAEAGARVTVIERKASAGEKLHTTGILVRDVVDQVPLLDGLPHALVRRIDGVRLYAPNMRHVDLDAPGYYFLATDTPGLMDWLALKAQEAGAGAAGTPCSAVH